MPEIKQDLRTATFIVAANDSVHKNMADYVCDGTSDETEINAAIAALPAGGGSVFLLEGNFKISAPIQLRGALKIEGQGINATKLTLANNANCNMFEYTGAGIAYFTEICGMTLIGNKANNASGNGIHTGGAGGAINDGYFHHLFINSFKENGLYIYNTWGMVIENVVSESNDGDGLRTFTAGESLKLIGCKLIDNTGHGVFLDSMNAFISLCELRGGSGCYGVYINSLSGASARIVANRFSAGAGTAGAISPNTSGTLIADNYIDGGSVAANGIYNTAGGSRTQIQNNFILNFTASGIHLDAGSDSMISNNRIRSCLTPIDIDNASVSRCQIQGNNWQGCTNNPSYAAAVTPVFTDNIDINGARWLVDDNEVVLKVSVAHDNQNPAIATIPAGSFVTAELWVNELFDSDGTDTIAVGYDADPNSIVIETDVSSVGRKAIVYGVEGGYMGTARAIEAYYVNGGSEPTTGHAVVVLRVTKSPTP